MNWLRYFKVGTRTYMLAGVTAVGLVIFCVVALIAIRDTMMDDRRRVRSKVLVEVKQPPAGANSHASGGWHAWCAGSAWLGHCGLPTMRREV